MKEPENAILHLDHGPWYCVCGAWVEYPGDTHRCAARLDPEHSRCVRKAGHWGRHKTYEPSTVGVTRWNGP